MNPKNPWNDKLTHAYNKYADTLYRIALTNTCNREDAEDACQDVFIKYACSDMVFKDDEHEKAWLIRVLINHCRDLIRKHKVRTHLSLDEIENVIADPHKRDDYLELTRALESLSPKYRELIILHYLEGFSTEECASILKITVSAVKMRLMRGKEMIRTEISKEEENA